MDTKRLISEFLKQPRAGVGFASPPLARHPHGRGKPKSPEHREKIRQATIARYRNPAEHEKTSRAVRRALRNIDRSGPNNPMFGCKMSEETKQKIRDKIIERMGRGAEAC